MHSSLKCYHVPCVHQSENKVLNIKEFATLFYVLPLNKRRHHHS